MEGDLHCVAYSLANVATQLSGGSPIPPDILFDRATMTFPFSLGNVTRHVQLHEPNYYGGDGLVGMEELTNDSDDDLLAEDSLLGSDVGSCTGSHHPSLECFATGTPDGYVEDAEDSPRHSRDHTPMPIPTPAQVSGGPAQPTPPPSIGTRERATSWPMASKPHRSPKRARGSPDSVGARTRGDRAGS